MNVSDVGTGLGTKFVTLDTVQTLDAPKIFHNNSASVPGPIPSGTTNDQYRFTDKVVGVDPTAQKHLATKDYVDRAIAALNVPEVGYGTGGGTQVVVNNNTLNQVINNTTNSTQGLTAALDLYDLAPRFKGHPIAYRQWAYAEWRQHQNIHFSTPIIGQDGVTFNASYMTIQVETTNSPKNDQVVQSNLYMLSVDGVNIPISGSRHWSPTYNNDNNFSYENSVTFDTQMMPLPKSGWHYIWGDFRFINLRGFSRAPTIYVRCWFYDYKTSQVYYIKANPVTTTTESQDSTYIEQTTEILVLGPDKVKPPTFNGAGLGITQSVVDGQLRATAQWEVSAEYVPGNPDYTGPNSLDEGDMEVLWEFVSRIGDLDDPGDVVNDNDQPGRSFGSGTNEGTNKTATSTALPSGEYMRVRLNASHPGKDPSSTAILDFQSDSPPISSVPANFAMTSPTNTSLNITWDAVAGVKYRVDIEEQGDGIDGKSRDRWVWTEFTNESSPLYAINSAGVTGSAGNLTVSPVASGVSYRAIIRAVAPNALVSPTTRDDGTGTQTFEPGSLVQATTTGPLSEVSFTTSVKATDLAGLTALVPDVTIPAGSIGVVESGADRGVYIYNPNNSPVWVLLT